MRTFGIIMLCILAGYPAAAQSWRSPEEPDYGTIKSGRCEVNVCTDFDFGDHTFRIYSKGRSTTLRMIPPGVCKCKTVQKAGRNFNNHLSFGIQTEDGRFVPGISVLRIWPTGDSRTPKVSDPHKPNELPTSQPGETTYEEFRRLENEDALEPVENSAWKDDRLDVFRVAQSKFAFGRGTHRYWFIPKEPAELAIVSSRQAIAFQTPLALPINRDGPTVAAAFRYSKSVQFFQLFSTKTIPPGRWMPELQNTSNFLMTRLRPISQ
jgi:hypothetical protein